MATTTAAAIRDAMITAIHALTPTSETGTKYRIVDHEDGDFRNWAENNASAALRKFTIDELGNVEAPTVSSTIEEWVWEDFEVIIAYPRRSLSRHGNKSYRSLTDVIRQDEAQVRYRLHNSTLGVDAVVTLGQWRRDNGQACLFATLPMRVGYWRSTT